MIPGGSTLASGSIPLQTGGRPGASHQRMLEMMDEKQILQYEIEQEKDKVTGKEKKHRELMET
jgi:hypothetical protein